MNKELQDVKTPKTLSPYSRIGKNVKLNNTKKENKKIVSQASLTSQKTDFSNKEPKKQGAIDKAFPDGKYCKCFICSFPVIQLESLTNIEGRPCHKRCKREFEAHKRKQYCNFFNVENQICTNPLGNERGLENPQLCSITESKNCELLESPE